MKVLQVLPELNGGGVERGAVEFSNYLVVHGYESAVISNGGRMVAELERAGGAHYQYPVHRKSFLSYFKVAGLRRLIAEIKPDIIHVRSRLPAWMVCLALKKMDIAIRPKLVSTFHGLYSVNVYSEIMGCGEQVVAISDCVKEYIVKNYPKISSKKIRVIHRGVDTKVFNCDEPLDQQWKDEFLKINEIPQKRKLLLMPGRLSPWKGQLEFIDLISNLVLSGENVHGLVVGEVGKGKETYLKTLLEKCDHLEVSDRISFIGHQSNMTNIYKLSDLVLNLSRHPEPFGRTVIESIAVGTPVVAFDEGGPSEVLKSVLPQNLAPVGDIETIGDLTKKTLDASLSLQLPEKFTLRHQATKTIEMYQELLS